MQTFLHHRIQSCKEENFSLVSIHGQTTVSPEQSNNTTIGQDSPKAGIFSALCVE
jgi:hypothetical protein